MDKTEIIKYLVEIYENHKKDTKIAMHLGIAYKAINKMFSIEIEGNQYSLSSNELSDSPDGIGDELANKIKVWAS